MIIAFVAAILSLFTSFGAQATATNVMVIPPMPISAPAISAEEAEDAEDYAAIHAEAFEIYADRFDAIFAGTEFKVSKNGRSMVKGIHATSFKFAKKG